ncbi:MAG: pentapeptide repeat-containing protein [Pseudomonadota bacterium]
MLEFFGAVTLVATHLTAFPEPAVLDADGIEEVRTACGVGENATFLDARSIETAQAVADRIDQTSISPTIVYAADLHGQDISVLLERLEGGCIHSSILAHSDASGAKWQRGSMVLSVIEEANWSKADLTGTRFAGVNAKEIDFTGATMDGGKWIGAFGRSWLFKSDFTDASMRGFTFKCGRPEEFDCRGNGQGKFDRVDFTDADLSEYGFLGYRSFDDAIFERTRINPFAMRFLKGMNVGDTVILAARTDQPEETIAVLSGRDFRKLNDKAVRFYKDEPSFNCDRPKSFADEQTCSQWGQPLRRMDRELETIYQSAIQRRISGVRGQHRLWRRKRSTCEQPKCVYQVYHARRDELLAQLGTSLNLEPGETMRFEQDVIPLTESMRRSKLYRTILPALREASRQTVTLRGLEGGKVQLDGKGLGYSGTPCTWNAVTEYDKASGWYVARNAEGQKVQSFRVWANVLEPQYDGSERDTPPEAEEFFECVPPAYFGRLRMLAKD